MDYDEEPNPPNRSRDAWADRCERLQQELSIVRIAARELLTAVDNERAAFAAAGSATRVDALMRTDLACNRLRKVV